MGKQPLQHKMRVRRRLGLLALVSATCFAGTGLVGAPAGAAPVTTGVFAKPALRNDGLAPIAATALAELQTFIGMGDPVAQREYIRTRDAIATEVAARLGVAPARMITAWQHADLSHQMALMAAFTQLGVPYRRNTSSPGVGFDCSGLTTYAWGVAGVTLTRQSGSQINAASPRTQDTAMAGDLMYYPGHVSMYLGVDRTMVHSPYPGRNVEVGHISDRRTPRFGNPIG